MRKKPVIAVLLLFFLVSCHSVTVNRDPALRLRERVKAFIEARETANLADLQACYLDPERARIANFTYIKSDIVTMSIDKNAKHAKVELNNSIQVMGFTFKNLSQTLQWKWSENDWFYLASDKTTNPFAKPKK